MWLKEMNKKFTNCFNYHYWWFFEGTTKKFYLKSPFEKVLKLDLKWFRQPTAAYRLRVIVKRW